MMSKWALLSFAQFRESTEAAGSLSLGSEYGQGQKFGGGGGRGDADGTNPS